MAYKELVKNLNNVREYIRDFYLFGFKCRNKYTTKSKRSYDNEKRRIESWLGKYMYFRYEKNDKINFLSIDSNEIEKNPLYEAFKAKSFTDKDIMLHFYLLDILDENVGKDISTITNKIFDNYMCTSEKYINCDTATIRNKLKEYEKIGIVKRVNSGRKVLYTKQNNMSFDIEDLECVYFFSEISPIGLIGSYIIDRYEEFPKNFSFKHKYILYAIESEIIYIILRAINNKHKITITSEKSIEKTITKEIIPTRIYISTSNGRCYLVGKNTVENIFEVYRIDYIKKIEEIEESYDVADIENEYKEFAKKLWNVSSNYSNKTKHFEMIIRIEENEEHILNRLKREGKEGNVEKISNNEYRYFIDVYDVYEMLPWIRTFIGRILKIETDDSNLKNQLKKDIEELKNFYGV